VKIRFYTYTLELKRPFTISAGSRTGTPAMMVEVEEEGIVGYGEASMPPYLGESAETAAVFLSKIDLTAYSSPIALESILRYVDGVGSGNNAAKAAVDIAIHDWFGKKRRSPLYRLWGLSLSTIPATSMTIGIGTKDAVRRSVEDAVGFNILKVKLGGENDREMIECIREVTDVPLRVDVNQGWKDRESALRMIEWLSTKGVEFVEQPMPKVRPEDTAWLRARSPLPLIADESVVRLADLAGAVGVFDGVNVKLMKSTGMGEAYRMMTAARALGMKVMIGCMTETSCAVSAAAQLSPLADYADLDGALLIRNDLFAGAAFAGGRIMPAEGPGIGATRL
jgi:L-alanine-DL-glutamate epimerase-like enolase superfamily enzyme